MTLHEFFAQNRRVALAFSGGVDSAYLLYAAHTCGCDVHAYYVKSAFQPQFELDDARRLAEQLKTPLTILELDILHDDTIMKNPVDRCYYCKAKILSTIRNAAVADGYSLLIDGTNASDDAGDRPGMRALTEWSIRSPLRECALTKEDVRRLSREAGLFTWDKPAYACLATRIPTDTPITADRLTAVEYGENELRKLGFSDFRVRCIGKGAKIQLPEDQLDKLLQHRTAVIAALKPYFDSITLDLEVRP